jgi:hypothetical protein
MPAAPIPCCALPVPIKPPAIAIAAAIASNGFVNDVSPVEVSCAYTLAEKIEESITNTVAIMAIVKNFDRRFRIINYGLTIDGIINFYEWF